MKLMVKSIELLLVTKLTVKSTEVPEEVLYRARVWARTHGNRVVSSATVVSGNSEIDGEVNRTVVGNKVDGEVNGSTGRSVVSCPGVGTYTRKPCCIECNYKKSARVVLRVVKPVILCLVLQARWTVLGLPPCPLRRRVPWYRRTTYSLQKVGTGGVTGCETSNAMCGAAKSRRGWCYGL